MSTHRDRTFHSTRPSYTEVSANFTSNEHMLAVLDAIDEMHAQSYLESWEVVYATDYEGIFAVHEVYGIEDLEISVLAHSNSYGETVLELVAEPRPWFADPELLDRYERGTLMSPVASQPFSAERYCWPRSREPSRSPRPRRSRRHAKALIWAFD